MSAQPISDYTFTDHARREMQRRSLHEELVRSVLSAPGQRWPVRAGRHVLQSRLELDDPPKAYLVRVFVDVDRIPAEVVTVYRTSKVDKYWRENS